MLIYIFITVCIYSVSSQSCQIPLNITYDSSVFFSTSFEVLYPSVENQPEDRNISVHANETVVISCNGGRFSDQVPSTVKTVLATCNQDSEFEVQDSILDLNTFSCFNLNPIRVRYSTEKCAPDSILIEAGFKIGRNIAFVPQIKYCFDQVNQAPVYATFKLTKSIGFIKSYLVSQYELDSVYTANINFADIYNISLQRPLINRQLGLPLNSTQYIDESTCGTIYIEHPGFCLSMRPLAYRGDFVYISQQYATYRYVNVAPQWSFLDYNLDKLERNVVDFVKSTGLDLEVYSGTYGILTLNNVELFAHINGTQKLVPIPLIFWKLIYDDLNSKATVFLTVNNPHLSDSEIEDYVICDDVSDEIAWLTWENRNITKGYSYACSYEDARKVIAYLPDIVADGVLM